MKRKFLFMACAALVVSAAAGVGYKTYRDAQTPTLLDMNVEALSSNEGGRKLWHIALVIK